MMQAAGAVEPTIPILRDDTDVFVLLVYWVWKSNIHSAVQMEKWDGSIFDINATVRALVEKCQGLTGRHAISWGGMLYQNVTLYPACGNGKVSSLKILGSVMPCTYLQHTGTEDFLILYRIKKAKIMSTAC